MDERTKPIVDVLIPAFNEEKSISLVIADIPSDVVREIVVCNNGSTDKTTEVAQRAGATLVTEKRRGYGSACLKGIAYLNTKTITPDIVVFIDGDYSDHPEEIPKLIEPIVRRDVDMVIGSRALGNMERGSMMPQQIFGNWLATRLISLIYKYHFTDLGPFRAIKYDKLMQIQMSDPDFGWTVEMQIKAAKQKLKCEEIPVTYRRRVGVSKVSGTLRGTLSAGHKIIWTIFKYL